MRKRNRGVMGRVLPCHESALITWLETATTIPLYQHLSISATRQIRFFRSWAMAVLLMVCFNVLQAQEFQPLKPGDKVPDILWTQTLNAPANGLQLSGFINKYILMDFWATWCTSCIGHFPQMDSLQKRFGDKLQIILVNASNSRDTKEAVTAFYENYKAAHKGFSLPIVTGDSFAQALFPFKSIPHYVWLSPDRKVQAITYQNEITTEHINNWVSGKPIAFHVKNDLADTLQLPADVPGLLVDAYTKLPIEGAVIETEKSHTRAISNSKGRFTVYITEPEELLIIRQMGYAPLRILLKATLNRSKQIYINLLPEATNLSDAVVYTGYQSLPKERATGSFEKIDNKLLNLSVSSDIISRLENTSSVYFDRRNNNQNISIHGASTLYGNPNPLVILDNFPYEGDIKNINPNDVESVTLLKDAAAASIWGVRAGNGVIVITTKKGRYYKKPVLEFNSNITLGKKPNQFYNTNLSSADFIDVETMLYNNGYYSSLLSNTNNRPIVSPVVELLAAKTAGTVSAALADQQINALKQYDIRNDYNKYLYRTQVNQQYALNYSGGSEKFNFIISGGYDKSLSNLVRNTSERTTLRMQNTYAPLKNLEITSGITFTSADNFYNNSGIYMARSAGKINIYPYARLADGMGNHLKLPKDFRMAYTDTAGAGKLLDWAYRPLDEINNTSNKYKQTDILFNLGANYWCNKNLGLELKYQYETQMGKTRNLYDTSTYFARNLINQFTQINGSQIKYGIPLGAILDLTDAGLISQSARLQANYHKKWRSRQELNWLAGSEIRQVQNASNNNRTYGFNPDILTYTNVDYVNNQPIYGTLYSPMPVTNPADFSKGVLRYLSAFSNASYSYNSRYTLTLSARKDASNLFGVHANQKAVPLWSAGFSWQLHQERFYHSKALPFLKLRFTYGYNGNVDNTLAALNTITYYNRAPITGLPYSFLTTPPNPELQWEKTAIFNTGLDFASRNHRFTGSIDYYRKKATGLIGLSQIDPTTGVLDPNQINYYFKGNVADMKGQGVDLNLTANILQGSFKWSANLLLNYTTSTVTKYNMSAKLASSYVGNAFLINPVLGKPLYTIYSYKWAGLDPATGDPMGYVNGTISKDYNSLVNIPVDQLQYHGSAIPLVYGTFRNNLSWKGFSLSVGISYKLGYYFKRASISYNDLFNNWNGHGDFAKRWQHPGDEKTTSVPSMIYPITNNNRDAFYNYSSVLVERGDHIRLQDIAFSYDLEEKYLTGKLPFKSLRLYTYINNIGILWKANKSGLDPDYVNNSGFPLTTTFSLGIKTTF